MNRRRRIPSLLILMLLMLTALACGGQEILFSPTATPASPDTTENPSAPVETPTPIPDELMAELDAQDTMMINLYQRVNPSVVYIEVSAEMSEFQNATGSGSGFVIDQEGHIVTNDHVVENADGIKVTFADGTVTEAELLGLDPYADLAVLKVDVSADRLSPLEMGDSAALQVGQRVIAIGNPFGLAGTMTSGIISALGRTLPAQVARDSGVFSNPEIIQTDAAINPGNSGGPLLDTRGRVVGVNTAIRSTTGVNAGVGFAVPINTVKRIVPDLIEKGSYDYPYLGITSDNRFSVAELAKPLDLPVDYGVLISEVQPGMAADKAGLQGGDREVEVMGRTIQAGGDIIIAIDGQRLQTFDDLIAYLVSSTEVGQEVVLTIMRDGERMEVPVTLGERP